MDIKVKFSPLNIFNSISDPFKSSYKSFDFWMEGIQGDTICFLSRESITLGDSLFLADGIFWLKVLYILCVYVNATQQKRYIIARSVLEQGN